MPRSSEWSLHFRLLTSNFVRILIFSVLATCLTHLILRDLIILIIFSEDANS
jgi:hypothetical protein